jgi:hypothetical protein
MKSHTCGILATILGAAALVLTPAPARAGTSPTVTVAGLTNLVLDLPSIDLLQSVEIEVSDLDATLQGPIAFSQDGAGKLKGSGTAEFQVESPIYSGAMTATYQVAGAISSKGGIAKLTFNATLKGSLPYNGSVYAVVASAKRSVIVSAPANTITGVAIDSISAGPYKGRETSQILDTAGILPDDGTGSWTLRLDLNDMKTGGTATVNLNSGHQFDFVVKGSVKAGKANLMLAAAPTSPGTKGSSLKVVVDTATGTILSVKGKISGQTVSY